MIHFCKSKQIEYRIVLQIYYLHIYIFIFYLIQKHLFNDEMKILGSKNNLCQLSFRVY